MPSTIPQYHKILNSSSHGPFCFDFEKQKIPIFWSKWIVWSGLVLWLCTVHIQHLLHYREKESAYLIPNLSGATNGNLAGSSSLDRQITSSLSLISVVVMFDAVLWNCESVTIFLNFLLVILTIHCEHFCVKKWPFKIFSKVAKYNFWHFLPLLPVIWEP